MEVVHIYKGLRDVTVNVSDDGDDWPWSGDWSVCRTNREMTKDLIKLEMMCRVYSFRPNWLQCAINQGKRQITESWNEMEIRRAKKN